MASISDDQPTSESNLNHHRDIILELVANGIEDDSIECKREWPLCREDLGPQLKLVKIIAGMANLHRSNEAYLVIGADIPTKSFKDVTNLSDFDPAKVNDLLAKFLDPKPNTQVHDLDNGSGGRFIAILISPSQRRPITICKSSSTDKVTVREGEVWIRSGTSTQLASRRQLDEIYELNMEIQAEARARQRFSHFRDEFEVGMRRGAGTESVANKSMIVGSRKELRSFIANALAAKEHSRLSMFIETIRDVLVNDWATTHRSLDYDGYTPVTDLPEDDNFERYLLDEVEPALAALTEISMMCVKHSGPISLLESSLDVFAEHFELVSRLAEDGLNNQLATKGFRPWRTLALAYASVRCIAVYAVSRRRLVYLKPLHNMTVKAFDERGERVELSKPLLFMPIFLYVDYEEFRLGRIKFVWD